MQLGGISSNTCQSARTHRPPLPSAETTGGRSPHLDGTQRQRRRVRDHRRPLSGSPARLLPADARFDRGCRRRPAGGLRQLLPGDARRRPRDQPAAVAVSDRPQPLPQSPSQADRGRPGIDGHGPDRRGRLDSGEGPQPRGVPPAARRRREAPGDAALGADAARDGRDVLRGNRPGDGDQRPVGQVTPRPRPDLARRGKPGPSADLR